MIKEHFKNVSLHGPGEKLFPLDREFYNSDTTLTVASSRTFSRPPDRFEVAALVVLDKNPAPDQVSAAQAKAERTADALLDSLQQCTAALPARQD